MNKTSILFIFDLDDTLIPTKSMYMFDQIGEMLELLKTSGVRLALASFNDSSIFFLEKNNIINYFDNIQGFGDDTKHKHIERIILCNKDISIEKMIFFDDSSENIEYIEKTFNIFSQKVDKRIGVTFRNIIEAILDVKQDDDIRHLLSLLYHKF
jgi:HAD superfamily phosphatase (TIGR01681 family)